MHKERVEISYSDLKKVYSEVIEFTRKGYFYTEELNKNTRIEEDLGLYGLDNEFFLIEFSKRFDVDFSKMNYEKYLIPDNEVANGRWVLLFPLLLPFLVIKVLLTAFVFPFSKTTSKRIINYVPFTPEREGLTLGDLMVSVIHKEFTERRTTEIIIRTALT